MTDAPHLLPGLSPTPRSGWPGLAGRPLTVLVGVTGVGKSTALAALLSGSGTVKLLPDRREVTYAVMILPVTGGPVSDREARFELTARYRALHPGGMAQALGSLCADPAVWSGPLVFDGLRGKGEVEYAAAHFPTWRFVSLHAPDAVRVRRLLGRADAFDQVAGGQVAGNHVAGNHVAGNQDSGLDLRAELADLKGVYEVFGAAELDGLAELVGEGHSAAEILVKTRIVVSERRNYDPQAAREVLRLLPAGRSLDLDTDLLAPDEVARRIQAWSQP